MMDSTRRPRHSQIGQNRSLERGIEILRAFRPGVDLLGNSELAERTGLPRATVSRLSQTLVNSGLLEHDRREQAYRLAAPVLSLGLAMRMASTILTVAAPLMRAAAEALRINVGLATADRDAMVYLESVRYNCRVAWRNVVAGQRIPIEETSLGRAYLYTRPPAAQRDFLARLKERRPEAGQDLEPKILAAFDSIRSQGFCAASWQPHVTALATPILVEDYTAHALNMSVTSSRPAPEIVAELKEPLLELARRLSDQLHQASDRERHGWRHGTEKCDEL
jgi:DNA-binding IclR family transcriptional regulator